MHHFRSLLIGRAQVQIPGLRILTFALHRHLQEHASIEPHRHRWSQAILYLSGQGRQVFANGAAQVQPGTLVVVPPGVLHAFHRTTERPPLCLMIDFRLHGARRHKCVVCNVNRSELTQVRQHLTHLLKLQTGASRMLRWESAMVILQLLITMLRASGWAERLHVSAGGATTPAIQRLLSQLDPTIPLMDLVQRSGYQRDHLNRLVRKETGLTLGQLRTRHRLAKAKALLAQGMQVANVGAAVGLPDRSYFARWFRRQTGQPPSRWSHRGLG